MTPTLEELRMFVRESNAIELIYAEDADPAFLDHLDAARWVIAEISAGRLVHPLEIHRRLMRRLLPPNQVGVYRQHGLRVDTFLPPSPQMVPLKMIDLWANIVDAIESGQYDGDLWTFHYAFECIHPFVDGNGRTGRLLLNELRLAKGMTWLTIRRDQRARYFDRIRAWQKANWPEWLNVQS